MQRSFMYLTAITQRLVTVKRGCSEIKYVFIGEVNKKLLMCCYVCSHHRYMVLLNVYKLLNRK